MDPEYPVGVRQRSPGDDAYLWIVRAVGQFCKRRQHSVSPESLATEYEIAIRKNQCKSSEE